ncbi:MAG: hypothetical protein A4E58_00260 [Syntrophorhabdus sp. PtaB.Bin006]|nr:MAG: hypothetical protein A4E58_00260 [Syntrophorhabdus sp. PtaB.Bin006]
MGHDPVVFAVEVLGGGIDISTDCKDGSTVFYLGHAFVGLHRGYKIPDIARRVRNHRIVIDMDQGVLVDLLPQITEVGLNIEPFQGSVDFSCNTPELFFLLDQVDFVSLVGDGEGTVHTGDSSTDYQGPLVHRKVKLL